MLRKVIKAYGDRRVESYMTQMKLERQNKTALQRYDDLPPVEALIKAWTNAGPHVVWHKENQRELRRHMPLVARAIDRIVEDDKGA